MSHDKTPPWPSPFERPSVITPAQCRAARALLDITLTDLAQKAAIGISTVQKFESGGKIHPLFLSTIQGHLEAEGVVFTENNGVQLPYIPGIA